MRIDQVKVGTQVRANRSFVGVPLGTMGIIKEDYGSGVMVEWIDLEGEGWEPLVDGFDKQTELQYLDYFGDPETT
jgi:hypothetical protein